MRYKKRDIRTWDIEAENWNKFKIASIYDGENVYICNSPREIIDKMIQLGGIFYSHYGSGYDHLFLYDILKDYKLSIVSIRKKLVKISVYYKNSNKLLFQLRDSFNILPSSLKKLAESFDVMRKLDIDRSKINELSEEELKEYVSLDSKILFDVLHKAGKIFEVHPSQFKLTIASETKRRWISEIGKDVYKKCWIPKKYDEYIRDSYTGGRTEVFKRFGYNLFHYDISSMYPSVMVHQNFPTGTLVKTYKYEEGRLGIYTCEIKSPKRHIPFLHTYHPETEKLVFPYGKWKGTYTSPEIEKARELGYKIKIIEGYFWTETFNPFKKYIRKWYKKKQKAGQDGNSTLRYISKLYLNSLYGKLGQRRGFEKVIQQQKPLGEYVDDGVLKQVLEELNLITIFDESRTPYTTIHLASFVTAYSRIMLYELFEECWNNGGEVYYTDTDCVVTDVQLKERHNLGGLELESDIKEGVFLMPKLYAYISQNGAVVTRAKGFSENFSYADYKKVYKEGKTSHFFESQDKIAGLWEGKRRNISYMDIISRERQININNFDKRVLQHDDRHTSSIYINDLD